LKYIFLLHKNQAFFAEKSVFKKIFIEKNLMQCYFFVSWNIEKNKWYRN